MLNWPKFEELPGGPQHNFEMLCRSLIRLRYGRYGQLAGLANQPGVEFHLNLHTDCDLGSKGRWFGWQCRWYDLPNGRMLGTTRRNKIEDAIKKTEKVLPNLTDWVLCTRHQLAKSDQKWFFELKKKLSLKMRLDLWYSGDIEAMITGDAEILRRTYFGDLLFLSADLTRQHEISVAQIRKRWLPEAHQTVEAERTVRRMLGESTSWDELATVAGRLFKAIGVICNDPRSLAGRLASSTPLFTNAARNFADSLKEIHRLLGKGDLELLRQQLNSRPRVVGNDIAAAPRHMRNAKLPCGLHATNALADMKLGIRLLDEVDNFLGVTLVGVIADAGGGKTQFAAQLTTALPDRPAGIFLHGRELHSGRTLNDLASSITIQGHPVPSMEALLAALDAAGQRARRRLPLVIDGLNEAENPMDWKAPLASLETLLRQFANVLVVCTVRTGARRPTDHRREWALEQQEEVPARIDFAKQALPDDVRQIWIPDFGGDSMEAIQKYFKHFRISPGEAALPYELLSHPLTLRIFCEVTNPLREREVSIEAMPGSLTALFGRYIDLAIERVNELAPRHHHYYEHDIRRVLDFIGIALWEGKARELSEMELRRAINDESRPWNESIIHMLEQEGVILLMPGQLPGQKIVIAVYDALGGYIVANSILARHGYSSLGSWLNEPATQAALNGDSSNCHPLSLDIFRSLVGLMPRRLHQQQLWQMLDEPLKTIALRMAAMLEASYLDKATVTAIADYIRSARSNSDNLFFRLRRTRGCVGHPLNADFFDTVLRPMPVGERDLHWTEWIRRNHVEKWRPEQRADIEGDVRSMEKRWQNNLVSRTPSDRLRAKWLMWLLTTSARNLRDRVTRALYWFGRGDSEMLFELTENAADVNDPYVFERMLAASYGVAMAAHIDSNQPSFNKNILPEHARRIFDLLFKQNAPNRTTHNLIREYGRSFVELAALHNRKLFTAEELSRIHPPFSEGGRLEWREIETEKDEIHGANSPFRMDFENYTLGSLADGRGNYDSKHPGYRKIRAQTLWRIQDLGWTAERFKQIDGIIESDRHRFNRVTDEPDKIDRYGKKYSWIAYFELSGWLQDHKLLKARCDYERTWDVDIDPSFPARLPKHKLISDDFLGDPKIPTRDWVEGGTLPQLTPYLRIQNVQDCFGPWIMLDGFFMQEDERRGRRLFCFIRSFLVRQDESKSFFNHLVQQDLGGRWLPEIPETNFTFAGEIPWAKTFHKNGLTELEFVVKEERIKVKREKTVVFLDGNEIELTNFDISRLLGRPTLSMEGQKGLSDDDLKRIQVRKQIVVGEETRRHTKKNKALIPVRQFGWEKRNLENESVHGMALARELASNNQLVMRPQTFDFLQDKETEQQSISLKKRMIAIHNACF